MRGKSSDSERPLRARALPDAAREASRGADRLVNCGTGECIAHRVVVAETWVSRVRGLLWRPPLQSGEALWIEPCNGVHTMGLRYTISVLSLDETGRVLRVCSAVSPNRIVWPVRRGRTEVEMLPETLARSDVRVGDRLILGTE